MIDFNLLIQEDFGPASGASEFSDAIRLRGAAGELVDGVGEPIVLNILVKTTFVGAGGTSMNFIMGTGSVAGGGSLSGNFQALSQTGVIPIVNMPQGKLMQLVVPPSLMVADPDAGYLGMVTTSVGAVGGTIDAWFSRGGEYQSTING